jgi:hypothetical protein
LLRHERRKLFIPLPFSARHSLWIFSKQTIFGLFRDHAEVFLRAASGRTAPDLSTGRPIAFGQQAKVAGGGRHDKCIMNKMPSGLDLEIRASLGQLSRTEFFACDA